MPLTLSTVLRAWHLPEYVGPPTDDMACSLPMTAAEAEAALKRMSQVGAVKPGHARKVAKWASDQDKADAVAAFHAVEEEAADSRGNRRSVGVSCSSGESRGKGGASRGGRGGGGAGDTAPGGKAAAASLAKASWAECSACGKWRRMVQCRKTVPTGWTCADGAAPYNACSVAQELTDAEIDAQDDPFQGKMLLTQAEEKLAWLCDPKAFEGGGGAWYCEQRLPRHLREAGWRALAMSRGAYDEGHYRYLPPTAFATSGRIGFFTSLSDARKWWAGTSAKAAAAEAEAEAAEAALKKKKTATAAAVGTNLNAAASAREEEEPEDVDEELLEPARVPSSTGYHGVTCSKKVRFSTAGSHRTCPCPNESAPSGIRSRIIRCLTGPCGEALCRDASRQGGASQTSGEVPHSARGSGGPASCQAGAGRGGAGRCRAP